MKLQFDIPLSLYWGIHVAIFKVQQPVGSKRDIMITRCILSVSITNNSLFFFLHKAYLHYFFFCDNYMVHKCTDVWTTKFIIVLGSMLKQ